MKLAVLDDYQRLALEYADWKSLKGVDVRVFDRPLARPEEELKAFDIVCLMRERTPFGRALIEKLPNLKFVSLTGARSPSLDSQALKERGIPVSNTRSAGGGLSTVELTWGLIIAGARGLARGERNMRAGRWHEGTWELYVTLYAGGLKRRRSRFTLAGGRPLRPVEIETAGAVWLEASATCAPVAGTKSSVRVSRSAAGASVCLVLATSARASPPSARPSGWIASPGART